MDTIYYGISIYAPFNMLQIMDDKIDMAISLLVNDFPDSAESIKQSGEHTYINMLYEYYTSGSYMEALLEINGCQEIEYRTIKDYVVFGIDVKSHMDHRYPRIIKSDIEIIKSLFGIGEIGIFTVE